MAAGAEVGVGTGVDGATGQKQVLRYAQDDKASEKRDARFGANGHETQSSFGDDQSKGSARQAKVGGNALKPRFGALAERG